MSTAFYKRELNLIDSMNIMANRVGRTHKSELSRKIQTLTLHAHITNTKVVALTLKRT